MDWEKFSAVKNVAEDFGVRSVLGVVPDNQDQSLVVGSNDNFFFDKVRVWNELGDSIAQHGTHHVYNTSNSGLLKINKKSEFAGHSYDTQIEMIKKGKDILVSEGIWHPLFMAPAHSFDRNTLSALSALDFTSITDGFGFFPYKVDGIILVPQMSSIPINLGFGLSTICLHTNTMSVKQLSLIVKFIKNNVENFLDIKDVVEGGADTSLLAAGVRMISATGVSSVRKVRRAIKSVSPNIRKMKT
tara:strand:- start:142 stop:873 length:732 start_codon:yes stop_codon:yes gene_type:complete